MYFVPGSAAQSIVHLTADLGVHKFQSQVCQGHIIFLEIDKEIISMVSLLLPLIQEGQLSVTNESMCTGTG